MRIEERGWGFDVFDDGPDHKAVQTTISAGSDGQPQATQQDISDRFPEMMKWPILRVAYSKEEQLFDVDFQAGVQRWHGWKTGREVGAALRRLLDITPAQDDSGIRYTLERTKRLNAAPCPHVV